MLADVIAYDIMTVVIALKDVIANIYCIILINDRCYCQGLWYSLFSQLADVIAFIVCGRHEPHLNRYCLNMDTSHSVCLNVDWLIFSRTESNFETADKLLPDSNIASSRSEEMLTSGIFQHKVVSQWWWALQFCCTHVIFCCCGRCLGYYYMALWVLFGTCYCHIIAT